MANKELILQHQCFLWRQNNIVFLRNKVFRIKNELDTHGDLKAKFIQLSENKATGVTKGIWDELIMVNPLNWVEYKVGKNDLTFEQYNFMNLGLELGHEFNIARTLEEYQNIIWKILSTIG